MNTFLSLRTSVAKKIFFALIAGCALLAAGCVPVQAWAKTTPVQKPYQYKRLFYFTDSKNARASLFAYWAYIDIFAPQSYALDDQGNLTGSLSPRVLDFAKTVKLPIMPLVTNASFDKQSAHTFLDDSAKQDRAIQALIEEAKKYGYIGWQLDFEQMDVSYRDRFSAFVSRFSQALHAQKLQASVAVVAQISENPVDYPRDLWEKLIGVYDYAALGKSVDFVSVMAYDDPGSTGPIARFAWLADVLQYSIHAIPREKLSLGIGMYYWHWNTTTGARIGIGGYQGILLADKKHYLSWHFSASEQAPYVSYWSRAMHYVLWYENRRSVQKKIDLIRKYRLRGFSAWALGLEVPSVYEAIGR